MTRIGLVCVLVAVACDGDEPVGKRGRGNVEVCVNEACDPTESAPEDETTPDPSGCFEVSEGSFDLWTVGGISTCESFEPGWCGVAQQDCTVTIECDNYPPITTEVDEDGRTDEEQVPLGDGVVADCHAEFASGRMSLVCEALGVNCEYTGVW
jgi:hypothetical protein